MMDIGKFSQLLGALQTLQSFVLVTDDLLANDVRTQTCDINHRKNHTDILESLLQTRYKKGIQNPKDIQGYLDGEGRFQPIGSSGQQHPNVDSIGHTGSL